MEIAPSQRDARTGRYVFTVRVARSPRYGDCGFFLCAAPEMYRTVRPIVTASRVSRVIYFCDNKLDKTGDDRDDPVRQLRLFGVIALSDIRFACETLES